MSKVGWSEAEKRQDYLDRKKAYRMAEAAKLGKEYRDLGQRAALQYAHVLAWKKATTARRRQPDAHVQRYRVLKRARDRAAAAYRNDPDRERARTRMRKAALCDEYVVQNLRAMGLSNEVISPALIDLKREAMALRRIARELLHAAKQSNKGTTS